MAKWVASSDFVQLTGHTLYISPGRAEAAAIPPSGRGHSAPPAECLRPLGGVAAAWKAPRGTKWRKLCHSEMALAPLGVTPLLLSACFGPSRALEGGFVKSPVKFFLVKFFLVELASCRSSVSQSLFTRGHGHLAAIAEQIVNELACGEGGRVHGAKCLAVLAGVACLGGSRGVPVSVSASARQSRARSCASESCKMPRYSFSPPRLSAAILASRGSAHPGYLSEDAPLAAPPTQGDLEECICANLF